MHLACEQAHKEKQDVNNDFSSYHLYDHRLSPNLVCKTKLRLP